MTKVRIEVVGSKEDIEKIGLFNEICKSQIR